MGKLALSAISLASIALLLSSQGALAQRYRDRDRDRDRDRSTTYNWNGFYGGGNLGGAFGGSDVLSALGAGVPFFESEDPAIKATYSSTNINDVRSFTGGVQAGYNLSVPLDLFWLRSVIVGLELDINALNAKKTKTSSIFSPNSFTTYTFTNEIDSSYIFSARPRVGIPVYGSFLYVTGGVAVTTLKFNNSFRSSGGFSAPGTPVPNCNSSPCFENASVSETKAGWTLGGGWELPLGPNVTFRTEYLFTDFGDISSNDNRIYPQNPDTACGVNTNQGGVGPPVGLGGTTPRQCFNHKADFTLSTVRAGINFRF